MTSCDLELVSIIGFDGFVVNGLQVHPDNCHILYPLGSKVCIQNWETKQQTFLSGHTDAISALAVSPNGKYVAAGQVNYMGFKSILLVWNFETHEVISKHEFHKVRTESITFSLNSRYVISLGGRDDCNVAIWDIEEKHMVGGNAASPGTGGDALVLCHCNKRELCFVSGGDNTLRLWRFVPTHRMVCGVDIKIGKLKRIITCFAIDSQDEHLYCGTTTGDILKVSLNFDCEVEMEDPRAPPNMLICIAKIPKKKLKHNEPKIELYSLGVTAIVLLPNDAKHYIVAAGDGSVEMVLERDRSNETTPSRLRQPSLPRLDTMKSTKLEAGATSLHLINNNLIAGTKNCEIYCINIESFQACLCVTCHSNSIFDIAFPPDFSAVFATGSKHDIRVWSTKTCKEVLRISVPNFTCSSVIFSYNGKAIISGWNDGVIRAFTPQTGKLMFAIHNAHGKGVSALRITSNDRKLVSGGMEGEVRIWDIKATVQTLLGVLKEHKGPISGVDISCNDTEAISSSSDGSCIIWDIVYMRRSLVIFRDTQFTNVAFFPSGIQFLTVGTDRKIGFWEVLDGTLIRELEGSAYDALNTVAIAKSGFAFVTGGCDQLVKLWNYTEGCMSHVGIGHAGAITAAKFSPDEQIIVSVSSDGGIFKWKCPCKETTSQTVSRPALECSRKTSSVSDARGDYSKNENIHRTSESASLSKASHQSDDGKNEMAKEDSCTSSLKVAANKEQKCRKQKDC